MTNKPDVIKAALSGLSVGTDKLSGREINLIYQNTNVYEKEIWNAAIKAAAMCQKVDIFAAIEIRKLKK